MATYFISLCCLSLARPSGKTKWMHLLFSSLLYQLPSSKKHKMDTAEIIKGMGLNHEKITQQYFFRAPSASKGGPGSKAPSAESQHLRVRWELYSKGADLSSIT